MAAIDITRTTTIDTDASTVWKILGEDFLQHDRWVTGLDQITPSPSPNRAAPNAPAAGRTCTRHHPSHRHSRRTPRCADGADAPPATRELDG